MRNRRDIANSHSDGSPSRNVRRASLRQSCNECHPTSCEAIRETDKQLDVTCINIYPGRRGSGYGSSDVKCLVLDTQPVQTSNNPEVASNGTYCVSHRSRVRLSNQLDASPLQHCTIDAHPLSFHRQLHNSVTLSSHPSTYRPFNETLTDAFPTPSCRSLTNHITSPSPSEAIISEHPSGTISRQKPSRDGVRHFSRADQSRGGLRARRRHACDQIQ